MNRATLVGRVSKEPELRTTASGVKVCYFSIAVQVPGKNSDGNKKPPVFIPCVIWNAPAENFVKYNKKGALVGVDGRICPREFLTKDGAKNKYFEIQCETISFLQSKNDDSVSETAGEHLEAIETIEQEPDSLRDIW